MLYTYTAKNQKGEIVTGKRESSDRFALSRELRDEGLSLIIAHESAWKVDFSSLNHLFTRVSLHEKVIFTRNLAAMLRAGISLARSLGILERQTKNFKLKKVLASLVDDINRGQSLSEGMKKFPVVFSSLFISMARAGEESGGLPGSLEVIGSQLEKSYIMGRKIRGALMYPAVILVAIFIIGTLMLIYVVPTLTATFKDMHITLPASTQSILFVSDFLIAHTFLFFAGIIGAILGFIFLLRTGRGRRVYDYTILRLPIFGEIVREVNAARTARTLSSLLSAGVDMRGSISVTEGVLQNVYYKELLGASKLDVEKGLPISSLFKSRIDLYPVMVGEMMEVGEETGKLSEMLQNIATFYEEEVDATTKDLSALIEPLLMIVIGAAVGFFAVAMISPTYSLLNSI